MRSKPHLEEQNKIWHPDDLPIPALFYLHLSERKMYFSLALNIIILGFLSLAAKPNLNLHTLKYSLMHLSGMILTIMLWSLSSILSYSKPGYSLRKADTQC